jgi:hypothetical protein
MANQEVPAAVLEAMLQAGLFDHGYRKRDLLWVARRIARTEADAASEAVLPGIWDCSPVEAMRHMRDLMLADAPELLDWLRYARPNYTALAWGRAVGRAQSWHEELARKTATKRRVPMKTRDVVMELPRGWAWVRLPQKEFDAEGQSMGFCLRRAQHGEREGYSLRDPINRPHVTLTVTADPELMPFGTITLNEIKGVANSRPPKAAYSAMVLAFLGSLPFGRKLTLNTHGDLLPILLQLYPNKPSKVADTLHALAPAASFQVWEELHRALPLPKKVIDRMGQARPDLLRLFYRDKTIGELLQLLGTSRSAKRSAILARMVAARQDELLSAIPFGEFGDSVSRQKTRRQALQGELEAVDFFEPGLVHRLRRKAKSSSWRPRALAALLLPTKELLQFATDLKEEVVRIASERVDPDHALSFFLNHCAANRGDAAWSVAALYRAPEAEFRTFYRRDMGRADLPHQMVELLVERAVLLGMPVSVPPDSSFDLAQMLAQEVSLKQMPQLVSVMSRRWNDGSLTLHPTEAMAPEVAVKIALVDPYAYFHMELFRPDLWHSLHGQGAELASAFVKLGGGAKKKAKEWLEEFERNGRWQYDEYIWETQDFVSTAPPGSPEFLEDWCTVLADLYAIGRLSGASPEAAREIATPHGQVISECADLLEQYYIDLVPAGAVVPPRHMRPRA